MNNNLMSSRSHYVEFATGHLFCRQKLFVFKNWLGHFGTLKKFAHIQFCDKWMLKRSCNEEYQVTICGLAWLACHPSIFL